MDFLSRQRPRYLGNGSYYWIYLWIWDPRPRPLERPRWPLIAILRGVSSSLLVLDAAGRVGPVVVSAAESSSASSPAATAVRDGLAVTAVRESLEVSGLNNLVRGSSSSSLASVSGLSLVPSERPSQA